MWSKKGDFIIDPFAGRSSRPLVSTLLERNYIGFDVLNDNLKEAQEQYDKLKQDRTLGKLRLINESSENIDKHFYKSVADLIMTCPPYFNIEKYDSADGQLTDIKTYDDFLKSYATILNKSADVLKPGGFFIVVLANFRIEGKFYDFVGDTKNILKQQLEYHDEIILEFFFFNDTATTEIYTLSYTLSLHDALPIYIALPDKVQALLAGTIFNIGG